MNNEEKKAIGSRIKGLRLKNGKSQLEVAELLGMENRTTYSNYEIGRVSTPNDILTKIADIFHTTTDYLLGKTENSDPVVEPEAEFHKDIELSDETLLEKYNFKVDGKPVDADTLNRVLEYLRLEKRLKQE